jgi:cold shock CspA family protein
MKKSLNFAVAAVFYFLLLNSLVAQSTKTRSNKEISMEVTINTDNRAVITWISQSDHQAARFIVQRSRDNEVFFDIREIEVKRESVEQGQRLQFSFTDAKILRNNEYYRIMEYEMDGESHIYSVLMIKPNSPVSIVRTGDRSLVRVMVEDSRNLTALVSTETGLGIPCEFELSGNNDVILKPAYSLNGGNYLVKLRSSTGEKQYKFTVKNDDVL